MFNTEVATRRALLAGYALWLLFGFACAGDNGAAAADGETGADGTLAMGDNVVAAPSPDSSPTMEPAGALAGPMPAKTPVMPAMTMVPAVPVQQPVGGGMAPPSGSSAAPAPIVPSSGQLDGDPQKPMVGLDAVPCGVPRIGFGGPPANNMVTIGGREVFVAYPCAHEDADVTFLLFIHGTLQEGLKIPFTTAAFPVHNYVDSDNFVVVAPQAIGTQWGNGDDGKDLPHLYEVIDWVYDTFGTKFNIRSMWASGGSWGAAYLSRFACDPMLEGRLRGVRMVVGGGCPRCAGRLSCIVAQQELELGGGMPLSDAEKETRVMASQVEVYAQMHGCDPRQGPTDLGPVRAWTWPHCEDGFVHSYYLGPGEHADRWDDPTAMDHMVAEIKASEP